MKLLLPTLKIWSELMTTMYGVNGFGKSVTEFYPHQFLQFEPSIHGCDSKNYQKLWSEGNSFVKPLARTAAESAIEVFCLFETVYDCTIEIEDSNLEWVDHSLYLAGGFYDPIKVRVKASETSFKSSGVKTYFYTVPEICTEVFQVTVDAGLELSEVAAVAAADSETKQFSDIISWPTTINLYRNPAERRLGSVVVRKTFDGFTPVFEAVE